MKRNGLPSSRAVLRVSHKQAAVNRALCALSDTVQKEFPLGTVIAATLGNARVIGVVVGHFRRGCHISAGDIRIRNFATGNIRRVTPHYSGHQVTVISLPEKQPNP